MQHVKDVVGPLVVGNYYLVDTLRIHTEPMYEPDAGVYYHEKAYILPVLGPAHADEGETLHYHLDQRFMGNKLLKKFGLFVLMPDGIPLDVHQRQMRCVSSQPKVPILISKYKYPRMKNMTCPHRGAYLGNVEPVNGCVTCPMHGLTFNVETGEAAEFPLDSQMVKIFAFRARRLGRVIVKNGVIAP